MINFKLVRGCVMGQLSKRNGVTDVELLASDVELNYGSIIDNTEITRNAGSQKYTTAK